MSLGIASIWRIALQKAIITHNIHVSSYFSMRCHVLHRVSQEEKAFSGLTLSYIRVPSANFAAFGRPRSVVNRSRQTVENTEDARESLLHLRGAKRKKTISHGNVRIDCRGRDLVVCF